MYRKYFFTILLLLAFNKVILAQPKTIIPSKKPALVVGLVIDQMRYDYLYKYNSHYVAGGFKRLLKDGNSCENTFINYLPTVTGCGHTCIYTGSVPAIHGIASNDWFNYSTGKVMYCAQDDSVQTVGSFGKSGRMSPKNMYTTTITDELRLATNKKSTVIGIALKDRGSILPAGHMANAAYWMDDTLGLWITSSYYMQNLPEWVTNFNNKNLARKYLNSNWQTIKPLASYTNSTVDNNKYEGKYKGEEATTMPHNTSVFKKEADIKRTPFGNNITLDFSKEAITNYKLGQNGVTDFLAISLSSTDYVGHQFGINAIETEDMYIRLDAEIAAFLTFLDKEVGVGNYTLFLTADHGAAHNPVFLQDQKIPAGYMHGSIIKKAINTKGLTTFGKNIIADMSDNMIWINDSVNQQDAITFIEKELSNIPEIQFVVETKNLHTQTLPDVLKTLISNGYNKQRSGQLMYILKPAFIESYNNATTGTTHGTWNPYDTHIPLVWFGNGIAKGKTLRKTYMTDITATLATLLQIQMPNGCIGETIEEVIKK